EARTARPRRARVASLLLPLELAARRRAARVGPREGRGASRADRPAARGPEVAPLHRRLPRLLARSPPRERDVARRGALSRLLSRRSPGRVGRRGAAPLLPGAAPRGSPGEERGGVGLRHGERAARRPL